MLGALCVAKQGALSCERCAADEGNQRRKGPSKKEILGCHARPRGTFYYWPDGKRLERCPRKLLSEVEWWGEFWDAWNWAQPPGGVLPVGGSLYEQSATFMQAYKLFNQMLAYFRSKEPGKREQELIYGR